MTAAAADCSNDMVINLYAYGMSVADIVHHLEQVYGTQHQGPRSLLGRPGLSS